MGLLGLYMGDVTRVRKKMVDSAVFLKLVRPLVLSDPAYAENRVVLISYRCLPKAELKTKKSTKWRCTRFSAQAGSL